MHADFTTHHRFEDLQPTCCTDGTDVTLEMYQQVIEVKPVIRDLQRTQSSSNKADPVANLL